MHPANSRFVEDGLIHKNRADWPIYGVTSVTASRMVYFTGEVLPEIIFLRSSLGNAFISSLV